MNTHSLADFDGRWIVLTGASSGIGRAIACQLSACGARVVLVGRNQKGLEDTAARLPDGHSRLLTLDLQQVNLIAPRIRELAQEIGRVFGLCYCSGVVETRPLASFQSDGFRSVMDVNLAAGLELAKVVCRKDVLTDEGGSLLFVASIYGWVGMPGQLSYSASKGAMLAAARVLAVELARRHIRVNTLSPGLVHTPMTETAFRLLSADQVRGLEAAYPLGLGEPEDVARAAAFLLAPQNRWITGTDLIIDGGYTAR
jgi:NAD(P)-dependent dehydrogenase (short-subunit alcohol dehydrogenase family)